MAAKIINRTNIPDAALLPLIQWVRANMSEEAQRAHILIRLRHRAGRVGGHAHKMAYSAGNRSRGFPLGEPFVQVFVGPSWYRAPYPITEIYKKRAGAITYQNWQEHMVTLVAHELRHIEQFTIPLEQRKKIGSLEVDAERWAMVMLARYRENPIEEVRLEAARKAETKKCPRCERTGDIAICFGYRTIKGKKAIPQSYCHECRRAHARQRRSSW